MQGGKPHPSSGHLVESDQDRQWNEDKITSDIIAPQYELLGIRQAPVQGIIMYDTVQ